jgi:hypothetical protein
MGDITGCHLWQQAAAISQDELLKLEDVETFVDESHLIRRIKRCPACGQLFFYQFREDIDWEKGEDPNWRILIPVKTREEAVTLNDENEFAVLTRRPRIQWSWTDTIEEPHWIR